jgi:hypothetical protein
MNNLQKSSALEKLLSMLLAQRIAVVADDKGWRAKSRQ